MSSRKKEEQVNKIVNKKHALKILSLGSERAYRQQTACITNSSNKELWLQAYKWMV